MLLSVAPVPVVCRESAVLPVRVVLPGEPVVFQELRVLAVSRA